ncbi:HTH domain-containing protein [Haloarchaeobius sp. HME9146]|uniref:HTH domain-containing protein n=1 Tax=Haloarchaeobius sp. HME9146 TaxID=2978732 RepID=UPI0034E933A6
MTGEFQTGTRLELWLRPSCEWMCRHEKGLVECTKGLADAGVVDEVQVEQWGKYAPIDPEDASTESERKASERLAEYREWAASEGVDLHAFSRTAVLTRGGEPVTMQVLPLVALASYDETGKLLWVVPHGQGSAAVSVTERLDDLEALASEDRVLIAD